MLNKKEFIMAKIEFDKEKCIKCGACAKDCITYSIDFDQDGYPKIDENGNARCVSCQHCFAICPTGAITFDGKKPHDATPVSLSNPDELVNLIKSRRSIRQFIQEEISSEDMQKIKDMLPFIPTGCNFNSLHFSIVESASVMNKIKKYTYENLLKLISNKFTKNYAGKFVKYKKAIEQGEDVIYRQAPHMIVVSSAINAPCANVDPIIALSYIELYANSLGLGTCWCGFAQTCLKIMPKLSSVLQIPDGYKPVYVMLLGKPAVKYQRTILPENFPISEIKDTDLKEMSFTEKARRLFLNFIR